MNSNGSKLSNHVQGSPLGVLLGEICNNHGNLRLMSIVLMVNAVCTETRSRIADDKLPEPAQNSINTAL